MKTIKLIIALMLCSMLLFSCASKGDIVDDTPDDIINEGAKTETESNNDVDEADKYREKFFDIMQQYQLTSLPEFAENTTPHVVEMQNYVLHLKKDELPLYKYVLAIPTDTFLKVAQDFFGATYELDGMTVTDENGTELIANKATSMSPLPFGYLDKYEMKDENGEKIATVTVRSYNFAEFQYVEDPEKELPDDYAKRKREVISGNVDKDESYMTYEIKYTTEDGITPIKFLSSRSYFQM